MLFGPRQHKNMVLMQTLVAHTSIDRTAKPTAAHKALVAKTAVSTEVRLGCMCVSCGALTLLCRQQVERNRPPTAMASAVASMGPLSGTRILVRCA